MSEGETPIKEVEVRESPQWKTMTDEFAQGMLNVLHESGLPRDDVLDRECILYPPNEGDEAVSLAIAHSQLMSVVAELKGLKVGRDKKVGYDVLATNDNKAYLFVSHPKWASVQAVLSERNDTIIEANRMISALRGKTIPVPTPRNR